MSCYYLKQIVGATSKTSHVAGNVSRLSVIAVALASLATGSVAATIQSNELAALQKGAASHGLARVMITLDDAVKLEAIRDDLRAVRATMLSKANTLRSELGREALETGHWSNGIGQIGLYVTSAGLQILSNSSNARSFAPDVTEKLRTRVHDSDGSLGAINAAISERGYADVEVFLNVDEGEYEIGKDGKTLYRPTAALAAEIGDRLSRLNTERFSRGFRNLDTARALSAANPEPTFKVRIDREAFVNLVESAEVRAIRPVGFVDARPALWDPEALERAKSMGDAEVIITLRGGALYSPKSGFMSAKAWAVQRNANQRALDDILSAAGVAKTAPTANHADLGSVHVRVPHAALARLYASADPRILSVQMNRAIATTSLTNSTVLTNLPAAWNANYIGTDQAIIVIDSGIRKDHELFKMNGATKVTYEACFGTNLGLYTSICPNADAIGDSPVGQTGSGEPFANLAVCSTLASLTTTDNHNCSHGTHVAGIAAGRKSNLVSPTTLQGGALGAYVVSVQVFSYDITSPKAVAFNADVLAALNAAYSAMVTGTNNPFTVNMSIGGQSYSSDCPTVDTGVTNAISNLNSRGVPVVVATGNGANKAAISWPACVPNTIKVSSVANDSAGTTLAGFANIGDPANFTGPIFLAPGGNSSTTVTSADRASTTATYAMRGTSQATPHITAVYSMLKAAVPGISVADATAWIAGTGSIGLTYTLPAPTGTQTYRRLRLPSL